MFDQADFVKPEAPVTTDPLERFFEALSRTPRTWRLVQFFDHPGRSWLWDEQERCPMRVCFGGASNIASLFEARKSGGLTREQTWAIAEAADCSRWHDPALRARLLQACGLA